ncbi:MAG: hypothetical protein ACTSYR_06250, partial [Candidatus Odinarchaeia archaeon]
ADTLGNFVHRVLVFCYKYFNGQVPNITSASKIKEIKSIIEKTTKKVERSIERFEFRNGLLSIIDLARFGNKFFNDAEPWKTIKVDKIKAGWDIAACINIVKSIGILLLPYLPETAEKIIKMLNLNLDEINWDSVNSPLVEGHKIGKPTPLFTKIEEDRVNMLRDKIHAIQATKGKQEKMIALDDLKKIKLVTGQVTTIQKSNRENNNEYILTIKISSTEILQKRIKVPSNFNVNKLVNRNIIIGLSVLEKNTNNKGILLKVKHEDGYLPLLTDITVKPGSKIL